MTYAKQMKAVSDALAPIMGRGKIEKHACIPWALVTFKGERHKITVQYDSTAIDDGERFVDALPDHAFGIPRQLVADAAVLSVFLDEAGLTADIELLLVEDV